MVVMVGFGALLWLVSARYWWWFWVWLAATVGFFATAWLYGLLFGWDT